ncbi:MAG: hypothetical protein HYT76_05785 [Deltaproteobacteria bacterium]|nr:hypothetical protein [Deltaproteobacteria bacterium]
MGSIKIKILVLMIVSFFFISPLFWTQFGCGSATRGATETTDAAAPTVNLTGTISAPATSASALSTLGIKYAASDTPSAAVGMTCEAFTLEGEDLGEVTVDANGAYTLAAVVSSLKPTDATSTSWKARFYIKCTDSTGKFDIRNYCETTVEEGTTTSITCDADTETTLTVADLLSKSGCQIGASCAMEGIDPLCYVELQKKTYKDANPTTGTGVQDDVGAVKEVARQCMAATTPGALGFASAEAMMAAAQAGSLTGDQLTTCGVGSDISSKYSTGATAASTLRDIFYTNIAGGSGKSASLTLEIKAISEGETGSACELCKKNPTYTSKLAAIYANAKDGSELETMKKTTNLDKTLLATLSQYCPSGSCDLSKFKPEALVGTLAGCGMDPLACGFVDANGTLQNVFDKMKSTLDAIGGTTDAGKLRSLGESWGDTFKDKGIGTAAGSAEAISRTNTLFDANIGSQGAAYDPTKADATFTSNLATITATGTSTVDTCLSTATTDATRLACYSTGTTTATTTTSKANAETCTANLECSSSYCGGTTSARRCTPLGQGQVAEVCSVAAQCSLGICTAGACASNNLPSSFTLTTGSLTANTCAATANSMAMQFTTITQADNSWSSGGYSGPKSGNTFSGTTSSTTTTAGCTFASANTVTGALSPFGCSGFTITMTVQSGTCTNMVGSNTVGASCVQTFGNASCATP